MRFLNAVLIGALCCAAAPMAHAHDDHPEAMVTDRPDQTESAIVVRPGKLQIETGLTITKDDDGHALEIPGTLFRVGIVERFELRIGMSGMNKSFGTDGEAGLGDIDLGGKLRLWDERGWRPEAALLFSASLPVGEDEFSSGRIDPSFRFSFAHTLSERVGLGYNLGMTWETGEEVRSEHFRAWLTGRERVEKETDVFVNYTATVGVGLTDQLGMFVEFFGDVGLDDADTAHYFDGGFTWAPLTHLQFDLSAGVGLNDAASDWFVGAGCSVRFPR